MPDAPYAEPDAADDADLSPPERATLLVQRIVGTGLDADAEIARLRALLAAAGVDPDAKSGGTP